MARPELPKGDPNQIIIEPTNAEHELLLDMAKSLRAIVDLIKPNAINVTNNTVVTDKGKPLIEEKVPSKIKKLSKRRSR